MSISLLEHRFGLARDMVRNEGDRLVRAVVSTPRSEYAKVENLEAHNITGPAHAARAVQQHDRLKSVLATAGCDLIDVPELFRHPNSVFTRDAVLCTPEGYIELRMGLPSRRGEERWMANVLDSAGEPCLGAITAPGTVEGGDIILAGSVAFIGRSGRTNGEGVRQISGLLERLGYEVRSAKVPEPYLHLGGAMSMLGPDRVLCCCGVFSGTWFEGFATVKVPSGSFASGNVICLGENEVIADRTNQESVDRMQRVGITVYTVDLSEFLKGTGGPSCLIMPLE
ncbi:MAG: dimethylarginine dimethylaminohydrolase family protein, partial [Fidelibacterota bacterium]